MLATAFVIYLIFLTALGIPLTIGQIGKPRQPLRASTASWMTIFSGLHIAGLVYVLTQL